MKIKKYLLGIVALLVFSSIEVNAQQKVTQGTTKKYHATYNNTPDYSLEWSITGPFTGNVISPTSGDKTTITWNAKPGFYKLVLTEKNTKTPDGCPVENTFDVEILGKPVLTFALDKSGACADKTNSLVLTYKFEDGTDITATNTSYFPFTVTYTVVDPENSSLTSPRTLKVNSPEDLHIDLSAADRKDQDPNTPSRILVVTLNDDAIITNGSLYIELGTIKRHEDTIYDIPELNPIIPD